MITYTLLCGCKYGLPPDYSIEFKSRMFENHFINSKRFKNDCDRKSRIEFKRLMKKWKQQPLPKDYLENKEDE